MTPALTIWREKLAGVTPLIAEARDAVEQLGVVHNIARTVLKPKPDVTVESLAGDLITRLTDALERSGRLSRILADEATVEGLARVLYEQGWRAAHVDVYPYEKQPRDVQSYWEEEACACLNHLAQLALGDGG